jgi:hypothetical protein
MPKQLSAEFHVRVITFGELERIAEEVTIAYFKVLSWWSLGEAKENYKRLRSE